MRRLFVFGICLALALPASALAANTAWVSSNHIQVVDLDAGQVVGRIALREFIHDMEFSRDGSLAYVALACASAIKAVFPLYCNSTSVTRMRFTLSVGR